MAGSIPKVTRSDRTRLIARDGHSLHFGLISTRSGKTHPDIPILKQAKAEYAKLQ
jgi:hypothetical protein